MEKHGDPTFELHVMMAEFWGRMCLRIADAKVCCFASVAPAAARVFPTPTPLSLTTRLPTSQPTNQRNDAPDDVQLLPFNHTDQALALRSYVTELEALLGRKDRTLDLRPLHAAVALYGDAAKLVEEEAALLGDQEAAAALGSASAPVAAEGLRERLVDLNNRIAFTERRFLTPSGLPRRPWFKHVGQAPGLYKGYGADSLPGVTQAVNDGKMGQAQQQVLVAAWQIKEAALFLAGRPGQEEGAAATTTEAMDVQ